MRDNLITEKILEGKTDAASIPSASASFAAFTKSSIFPAPPDAITGTFTAEVIFDNNSISYPFFIPSSSMLFTTISPAYKRGIRKIWGTMCSLINGCKEK